MTDPGPIGKHPARRAARRLPPPGGAVRSPAGSGPAGDLPLQSHLDRFVLAFRRDLLEATPQDRDAYVRLYRDEPQRFAEALRQAWADGRTEPYVSMAQALDAAGSLGAKGAGRMVHRLLAARRWREALEVLNDPRYGLLADAGGQLGLAQAELGQGRPAPAMAATARARELDPAVSGRAVGVEAQALQLQQAQGVARRSKAWPATLALLDRLIELDAAEAGLRAAEAFLAGDTPLDRDELNDFHLRLDALLSMARPASGYSLFRAMERLGTSTKAAADARLIAEGLAEGRGAQPPRAPVRWRSTSVRMHGSGALAWGMAGRLEPAIDALGELTVRHPKAVEFRAELARFVGRDVLHRHPLAFAPPGPRRRVFDVFIFNSEVRLLKLKLHAMADFVDRFVLVEARHTFTGQPKPLTFKRRRAEFAEFEGKIVHVVVDEFPAHVRHPWSREFHQRDVGIRGLSGLCAEDDLVIISDADEVVSPGQVLGFQGAYARLGMERARYFLNYREALEGEAQNEASSLWRAGYLSSLGLSYARNVLRFDKKAPRVNDAGWHFTSVSDAAGIAAKMGSTAHQEHSRVKAKSVAASLARMRAGELEPGWERCDLDDRFPAWLRENREQFADLLL